MRPVGSGGREGFIFVCMSVLVKRPFWERLSLPETHPFRDDHSGVSAGVVGDQEKTLFTGSDFRLVFIVKCVAGKQLFRKKTGRLHKADMGCR